VITVERRLQVLALLAVVAFLMLLMICLGMAASRADARAGIDDEGLSARLRAYESELLLENSSKT
jgi:hypothetical protein